MKPLNTIQTVLKNILFKLIVIANACGFVLAFLTVVTNTIKADDITAFWGLMLVLSTAVFVALMALAIFTLFGYINKVLPLYR